MAKEPGVKNNRILDRIKDSFAVTKPGGISGACVKLQNRIDKIMDMVLEQADRDRRYLKVLIWKKLYRLYRSYSISVPGGMSERLGTLQEKLDWLMDIVAEKAEKDCRTIAGGLKKAALITADWFSVTSEGGPAGFLARGMNRHDFYLGVVADNVTFLAGRAITGLKAFADKQWEKRMQWLKYFSSAVVVIICMISVFNYATGYEYSYNGKVLGLVKEQEDVTQIVDLASKGLTREYGVDVQIDPVDDFSFRKVVTVNRAIDSSDDVLKKLTYVQDTRAEAYGIYVGNVKVAIVDSIETAEKILSSIRESYLKEDGDYTKVEFKQNVQTRKVDTTLGKLMNAQVAESILKNGANKIRYTVEMGDTVETLTESFSMSEAEFYALNSSLEKGAVLQAGQVVSVVSSTPKLIVVTEQNVTYSKTLSYDVKKVEDDSIYEGESEVTQKGKVGKAKVKACVICENGEKVSRKILKTTVTKEPVTKIIHVGTRKRPSYVGDGNLINPCPAGYWSSGFGQRWGRLHRGIDMACGVGNPIYAADGGVVVTAGFNGSYGNYIKINHQNGMVTTYAHCSRLLKSVGDRVGKGELIALVGNTGNSTGAHCHFEVEINGVLHDPRNYL